MRCAGFQFVLEAHPQTVSQEGDHDVGFDPLGGEVPDRPDGQVAFERTENGFDFCKLCMVRDGIAALKVGSQQVGPVAAGGQAQRVAIPPPVKHKSSMLIFTYRQACR